MRNVFKNFSNVDISDMNFGSRPAVWTFLYSIPAYSEVLFYVGVFLSFWIFTYIYVIFYIYVLLIDDRSIS